MNPLDTPGTVFHVELMNPNPTSSKTKNGPVYRVSFEMQQDDWQRFMDSRTNGMILAMEGVVVELGSEQPQDKPKGGKESKKAAMECEDEMFNAYAESEGYENFRAMIYSECGIFTRAQLDHDPEALRRYGELKAKATKYGWEHGEQEF